MRLLEALADVRELREQELGPLVVRDALPRIGAGEVLRVSCTCFACELRVFICVRVFMSWQKWLMPVRLGRSVLTVVA